MGSVLPGVMEDYHPIEWWKCNEVNNYKCHNVLLSSHIPWMPYRFESFEYVLMGLVFESYCNKFLYERDRLLMLDFP
jgi:hypothetical protein